MPAVAKKLDPTQSTEPANDTFPPLQKGEFLMEGLVFPAQGAWGNRHLLVGKRYDFGGSFGVSGVVERVVALSSGVCRAYVRESVDRGKGTLITFVFFPTGTYGAEAATE